MAAGDSMMGRAMLLSALLGLLLIGARAQECTPLADVASDAGLTTLLTALEATQLLGDLATTTSVTILAPSNAAFDAAVAALGITIDDLTNNEELLTEVLLYHVLRAQLLASDVVDGESYPTLLGNDSSCGVSTVAASVDAGAVTLVGGVTNASVVDPDFETCSGIVHVIDFVLLPCPLGGEPGDEPPPVECESLTAAAEEAGLTTLLAALSEAGVADLLSGLTGSTIFAPTNEAFDTAVASLGITIDDLINNEELLEEILLYHVLETTVLSNEIVYSVDTETLLGNDSSCGVSTLTFESSDAGGVVVNGGASSATVVTPDVQICSGVVHIIDTVLLPCPSPESPPPAPAPSLVECQSLTEAAEEAGLTTLLAALSEAGFTDLLLGLANSTVFAPTNEAFDAVVASLGITIDDLTNNEELLEEVLLYHVLEATVSSNEIVFGVDTETLLGNDSSCGVSTLAFESSDDGGVVVNGGASSATVVTPDVQICSGVVHIIDTVLLPCPSPEPPSPAPPPTVECPSLTETAEAAGLTTLLAALGEADLTELLSGSPNFTIFAPTNEAFDATVASLGITIADLTANDELLQQVLLYHVLEPTVLSNEIVFGVDTETLLGNDSTCGVSTLAFQSSDDGGVVVIGGASSATVVNADVTTCTGVLHVIDNVLLPCPSAPPPMTAPSPSPPSSPSPSPTPSPSPPVPPPCKNLNAAAEEAGLTTFLAAVVEAGLTDTLSESTGLTILAPTNEAFDATVASLGITIADLTNNKVLLQEVLLYHVLTTRVFAGDITYGVGIETTLGNDSDCGVSTLTFERSDDGGVVVNGGASSATVVTENLEVCPGVLHVIDNVLLPCPSAPPPMSSPSPPPSQSPSPSPPSSPIPPPCKSLTEAAEEAGLTALLAALSEADLAGTLSDSTGLTIFAPTNEAFDATVSSLGITIADLTANNELLQQVLLYHVLNIKVFSTDIPYGVGVETLLGNDSACGVSTVSFGSTLEGDVVVNGGISSAIVVTADVEVCPGVLHVINNVLLPCPPPGEKPKPKARKTAPRKSKAGHYYGDHESHGHHGHNGR